MLSTIAPFSQRTLNICGPADVKSSLLFAVATKDDEELNISFCFPRSFCAVCLCFFALLSLFIACLI